jgi:hypothetical protein
MKRSYWYADPNDLKNKYLKALPYLSLEDTEVHSLESKEYKELKSLRSDMHSVKQFMKDKGWIDEFKSKQ